VTRNAPTETGAQRLKTLSLRRVPAASTPKMEDGMSEAKNAMKPDEQAAMDGMIAAARDRSKGGLVNVATGAALSSASRSSA
jgi:hypothetical protein